MNKYLEHHTMRIKALSPIHIGSGERLMKKEYIYLPRANQIIVPDIGKMYMDICRKPIKRQYEEFLLYNKKDDLGQWLKSQGFRPDSYEKWKKYVLDTGDLAPEEGYDRPPRPREIITFVKDGRGEPYVPGSSIKGMIRTALLCWEIRHNKQQFSRELDVLLNNLDQKANRNLYLARETDNLETKAFHTLNREETRISNAVNSNMSGLIIGDSRPIPLSQLTLSQKIDYTLDHDERPLPILKESLKPGTSIEFDITIDTDICPYTIQTILEALDEFQQISYERFYSKFGRGMDQEGTIWLGGGCGFLSKTIIYAVFDREALSVTDTIFKNTLGKQYDVHKHWRDKKHGIAPHVCKCTRYHGKLYDMGMGKIELIS